MLRSLSRRPESYGSVESLEEILGELEFVLLMTVAPGFGGQQFIPSSMKKITRLGHPLAERGLG